MDRKRSVIICEFYVIKIANIKINLIIIIYVVVFLDG